MNLASNAKLLTSVAALGTLGGGFRWRTAVYADEPRRGDRRGQGRPLRPRPRRSDARRAATSAQLAADARRARRAQDRGQARRSTTATSTATPSRRTSPSSRRSAPAFRAPVASFGVARSAITVNVIAEPGGAREGVARQPDAGDYIKLTKTEVKSDLDEGRTRLKVDVKPKQGPPRDRGHRARSGPRTAAAMGASAHRRSGAVRRRGVPRARSPSAASSRQEARSVPAPVPPTREAARRARQRTALDRHPRDEQAVRQLLRRDRAEDARRRDAHDARACDLGRRPRRRAQATSRRSACRRARYRADNGSGLFDATEVSAKQLVTLLRAAHADYRIGPDLVASLPVGGIDGTLAQALARPAAQPAACARRPARSTRSSTLAGFVARRRRPRARVRDPRQRHSARSAQRPRRAMADDMIDAIVAYLEAAAQLARRCHRATVVRPHHTKGVIHHGRAQGHARPTRTSRKRSPASRRRTVVTSISPRSPTSRVTRTSRACSATPPRARPATRTVTSTT